MSTDREGRLDDPERLAASDPGRMLSALCRFPDLLSDAWNAAPDAIPPVSPRRILVGGMGGSAIAGELIAGILAQRCARPIVPVRAYHWPHVEDADLLVVCSYSGDTEETLSLFTEATGLGAPLVALATGGELERRAAAAGVPFLRLVREEPPLAPRAALPDMLGRLLALLAALGEPFCAAEPREGTLAALRETAALCAPERSARENPAKRLALALGDERPVFVSLSPAYDAAALRLRTQFEENAKLSATSRALPELHHNSWIPWLCGDCPGAPVWLGGEDAHPRVAIRRRLSEDLLAERGIACLDLPGRGENLPARVLTSVLLGDFLSVYHALMRGVDPTPTTVLSAMKERLGEAEDA